MLNSMFLSFYDFMLASMFLWLHVCFYVSVNLCFYASMFLWFYFSGVIVHVYHDSWCCKNQISPRLTIPKTCFGRQKIAFASFRNPNFSWGRLPYPGDLWPRLSMFAPPSKYSSLGTPLVCMRFYVSIVVWFCFYASIIIHFCVSMLLWLYVSMILCMILHYCMSGTLDYMWKKFMIKNTCYQIYSYCGLS